MKPKIKTILLLLVFIFIAVICHAVSDSDPERLDAGMFSSPQRPGAVFDHDAHNEMADLEDDCGICHHVFENGRLVEDETSEDTACGECHTENLRKVFHNRCKSCHFQQKKGPVLCGECHVK